MTDSSDSPADHGCGENGKYKARKPQRKLPGKGDGRDGGIGLNHASHAEGTHQAEKAVKDS